MKNTQKEIDELSYQIIGWAIEGHRYLGPGLLESIYEKCFLKELKTGSLVYRSREWLSVMYKGEKLEA
ncbi:MAG: GxxExxY protein [Chitinophagaceae bacterium]|nr:GxxExxY protein [Chitinophagaceae bacterium]